MHLSIRPWIPLLTVFTLAACGGSSSTTPPTTTDSGADQGTGDAPGDTITTEWGVAATEPKRSLDGGLVTLRGTARNQHGAAVVEMEARLLVANAPFGDFRRRAEAR